MVSTPTASHEPGSRVMKSRPSNFTVTSSSLKKTMEKPRLSQCRDRADSFFSKYKKPSQGTEELEIKLDENSPVKKNEILGNKLMAAFGKAVK